MIPRTVWEVDGAGGLDTVRLASAAVVVAKLLLSRSDTIGMTISADF